MNEKHRRKRIYVLAAILAATTVFVVVLILQTGQADSSQALDADQIADANAAITVVPASYTWNSSPAILGWNQTTAFGNGMVYVLSTAPATRRENFPNGDIPKAIYTTTDGVEWSTHELGLAPISQIAAQGGLLYAVGTAPGANANSVDMAIGVSSDDGATFDSFNVPLGDHGADLATTDIVATADGVLATGSVRTWIDFWSVLPPGTLEGSVEPFVVENGIAVFPSDRMGAVYEACTHPDNAACRSVTDTNATFFATWEELGMDDPSPPGSDVIPTPSGTLTNRSLWSADGQAFEPIPYPFGSGSVDRLFRLGDGAAATVNDVDGMRLFTSDDARTWTEAQLRGAMLWVVEVGMVGDTVVVVAQDGNGSPVIYRADHPAGPYEIIPVLDELALEPNGGEGVWINSASVTDAGVAIGISANIGSGGPSPFGQILRRILPGSGGVAEEGGDFSQVYLLLVSTNLAEWSMTSGAEIGGNFADTWTFSPAGTLFGHVNAAENGIPVRRQVSTTP